MKAKILALSLLCAIGTETHAADDLKNIMGEENYTEFKNKTLTKLNLRHKWIGPDVAQDIAKGLKSSYLLKKLDLSGNVISDDGAKYIGESLKENKTLIELNLRSNGIRDEGAKYIGESLKDNETLIKLCLNGNGIKDKGAKYILEGLKNNNTLTELGLNSKIIRGSLWAQIRNKISYNYSLRMHYLYPTGEEGRNKKNLLSLLQNVNDSKNLYFEFKFKES